MAAHPVPERRKATKMRSSMDFLPERQFVNVNNSGRYFGHRESCCKTLCDSAVVNELAGVHLGILGPWTGA
jgi:hypothetical protein